MNLRRFSAYASVALGAMLFSLGLQALAFTQPSTSPPGGDAYAPLDTSANANSKVGGLLLNTGGAANGLIVQSGNVGIDTASPGYALDVNGVIKTNNYLYNATTGTGQIFLNSAGTYYGNISNPATQVWALGYGSLGAVGTPVLSWNASGNVGIGTNSPGYKLDVNGAVNATSLLVNGSPVNAGGVVPSGTYTWTGLDYFLSNKGAGSYLGSQVNPGLMAYSSDGGTAFMSFHRGGNYAVNLGLDPDNVLRIGGWSAAANRWQLDMSGNETLAGSLYAANFYPNNTTYGFIGNNVYADTLNTGINGDPLEINYYRQGDVKIGNGPAGGANLYVYGNIYSSSFGWLSNALQLNTWSGNHYSGSDGAEYATIFYDTNNSGYYVDPNGNSNINALQAGGGSLLANWPGYNGIAQTAGNYIWPGFQSGQGSGWNQSYYLAGSTSWGLYSNTSLDAQGLYDSGNRVYSAVNPGPGIPGNTWWGSTYYGSNGDVYLGYWGIWLSTELSNLTNGYASSAGTCNYATTAGHATDEGIYRFGGTYVVRNDGACISANPATGACSCPSGYSPQTSGQGCWYYNSPCDYYFLGKTCAG